MHRTIWWRLSKRVAEWSHNLCHTLDSVSALALRSWAWASHSRCYQADEHDQTRHYGCRASQAASQSYLYEVVRRRRSIFTRIPWLRCSVSRLRLSLLKHFGNVVLNRSHRRVEYEWLRVHVHVLGTVKRNRCQTTCWSFESSAGLRQSL